MASCRAAIVLAWNRRSVLKSCAISLMSLTTGSFLQSSSIDFWYRRISRRATVPGLYLWGFLTPPVAGAFLCGALFPASMVSSTSPRALLLLVPVFQSGVAGICCRGCFPANNRDSFSFFVSFLVCFFLTMFS